MPKKKLKLKHQYINPANINAACGTKVVQVIRSGVDYEVIFDGEPTLAEIQAVQEWISQPHKRITVVVEDAEKGVEG